VCSAFSREEVRRATKQRTELQTERLNRQIRPWEDVVKLPSETKPPADGDRGHSAALDAPKVMPGCAVWKERGVNPGDLDRVDG
jgi:hypothetical protein